MGNLPKRDDKIYKEIESFKDYELTQCVVYEMAVRNKINLLQIDKIVSYYEKHKDSISFIDENEEYDILLDHIHQSELIPFTSSSCAYKHDELCDESYFIDNLNYYEDTRINKTIYTILNDITGYEDGNRKRGLYSNKTRVVIDDILDRTYLEKRTFRNGYFIETSISESCEHAIIPINEKDEDSDCKELANKNDWKTYLEDGGENLLTENKLYSNFKRPKLKIIGHFFRKYPKFDIDLNLPLNELIAYVTHIKNDIEKNNLLKAPIELVDEELQKADDIHNMCAENRNGTLKCFDKRKGLKRTQKLADMFFIYDMIEAGAKKSTILYNLDEYYDPENKKQTSFHPDTLDKYLLVAKDYIDNLRYRELVTGIKL